MASCSADSCVSQDEKVLIECWMGAKWGFRKFPLSPKVVRPTPGVELDWRELPPALHEITEQSATEMRPNEMWLSFDLNAPLGAQLESARLRLATRQHALAKKGQLLPRNAREGATLWQRWLRILDALEAGTRPEEIATMLVISDIHTEISAARAMTEEGYRRLIALNPEKNGA